MRMGEEISLKSRSTRDFAYYQLKKDIISGQMKPDTPIVEDQIARKLAISRTPLREALQRLEVESLIVRQPNGRLRVSPITSKEVREIFTVRKKLEEIVMTEAIDLAEESDYDALANILLLMRETVKQKNIDDALYYGGKFHQYIYEMSRHDLAGQILGQLNDRIYRYRRLLPIKKFDSFKQSIEEHEHILNAMKTKDKDGTIKSIQDHLDYSLESIVHAIESNLINGGNDDD